MPPLRALLPALLGALIGKAYNRRQWRRAERSIGEAATAYGEYLAHVDEREQRLLDLARRQARLAAVGALVAVASLVVAAVALFGDEGESAQEFPAAPVAPPATDLSFYELAAQIFPLLFVALTIESTFLSRGARSAEGYTPPRLSQARELVQVVALLTPFVIGEWVALQVLLTGAATPGQEETVTSALVVCGALLIAPVLIREARSQGDFAEEAVGWTIAVAVAVGFGLLVVL